MGDEKKQKDSKDNEYMPIGKIITCSLIGILVLWGLTFLLFFMKADSFSRGEFGDMFGAVNALFSGLAFAGLIITLILQRQELGYQREELEQTREEMKNQRAEFEKENETLKYQRFENLFYNMLNLQQEIVSGLRFDYQDKETVLVPIGAEGGTMRDERIVDKVVTGREVFRYTFVEVEISLKKKDDWGRQVLYTVYGYRGYLNREGMIAYDVTSIPTYYDHYFRHLYKIIQFVDSQGFPFDEAYKYVSLLRGTLSRYELVWIYYNALSFEKFKHLIEKYTLLKNLREDLMTRCAETDEFYKGLGIKPDDLQKKGFSATDFEYFLTDAKGDDTKYHISAFWKPSEIEEGVDRLTRWKTFVRQYEGNADNSVS